MAEQHDNVRQLHESKFHESMLIADGTNEREHGHECIWRVCLDMEGIWLHGVGFVWDIDSLAQVQHARTPQIQASNL